MTDRPRDPTRALKHRLAAMTVGEANILSALGVKFPSHAGGSAKAAESAHHRKIKRKMARASRRANRGGKP